MQSETKSYSTDEFGRPNDRDYHYRIHMDNDRAVRKAHVAEALMDRVIFWSPKDMEHLDKFPYLTLKTADHKGHIPGLAECACSPMWEEFPAGPGRLGSLEMKSVSGGTKLRGDVYTGHERFGNYTHINTVVDFTPGEIKAMWETDDHEEDRRSVLQAIDWAVEDTIEKLQEKHEEARQAALESCDHGEVEETGYNRVFCHCCLFEYSADEL